MQGLCRAEQGEEEIQPQEEGTQEGTEKIQMNDNAPFFKPFFVDFSIKMGESNRPEWVDMLRFRHSKWNACIPQRALARCMVDHFLSRVSSTRH